MLIENRHKNNIFITDATKILDLKFYNTHKLNFIGFN